ncbi:hypothetical protein VE02_04220 [Pseudogymnoascus sp. 03VT05]|nr:hypothetical protein VE02_04220 [Pseudogymnoascus sp. 03VT05]
MTASSFPRLCLTDEELQTGVTSPATIQAGLEQFYENGFVIIENAIHHNIIDRMRERMEKDIPTNLASSTVSYNHGFAARNVCQIPPLEKDFIYEELYANHHAIAIIEHILGPRPQLSWISSNIALPNSLGRQAVHADFYAKHLNIPTGVEVYTYLSDTSPENGSTELWPGTHVGYNIADHVESDSGWIKQEVFSARAAKQPPIQPYVRKGSICFRDLRMWHAGMPNHTNQPRIMLAFIYFPRWFDPQMRLTLPASVRESVGRWTSVDIIGHTDFVEGPIDYLHLVKNLDFEQKSRDKKDDIVWIRRHGGVIVTSENYWSSPARVKL